MLSYKRYMYIPVTVMNYTVYVIHVQALQYGMRDFVQSWYHVWVSANSGFPDEVQRAIITMATDLARRYVLQQATGTIM